MTAKSLVTRLLGAAALFVALAAAPARAEVTENDRIPVDIDLEIPCANGGAGDVVTLTGDLHVLTTFVVNGNVIRGRFHDQPDGIVGFGSINGERYEAKGVSQGEFKASLRNGQAIVSFINNFRIIGQGQAVNYMVHQNLHLIINANGDTTAVVDGTQVDCQ